MSVNNIFTYIYILDFFRKNFNGVMQSSYHVWLMSWRWEENLRNFEVFLCYQRLVVCGRWSVSPGTWGGDGEMIFVTWGVHLFSLLGNADSWYCACLLYLGWQCYNQPTLISEEQGVLDSKARQTRQKSSDRPKIVLCFPSLSDWYFTFQVCYILFYSARSGNLLQMFTFDSAWNDPKLSVLAKHTLN